MIAVNNFFDSVGMLFNEKQGGFLAQSSKERGKSFENVLNNTVERKKSDSMQKESYSVTRDKRKNVSTKIEDDDANNQPKKTEPNVDSQDNKVKDNTEQRVVKKESTDKKENSKENKFDDLNDEDKAIVKEMADKLNINPEALMNLMQAINIDFKSLLQSSLNLEEALKKITTAIENTVEKLNLNPIAVENKNIMAKIQLLINQQKNSSVTNGNENTNLNFKVDNDSGKNQMDVQKSDAKVSDNIQDNIQDKTSKTEIQHGVHVNLQNKDEKTEMDNQIKVDVTQQLDKKSISHNAEKSFGEMDNSNQQRSEDAGKQNSKNNDKVDMQTLLNNVRVVNLKTEPKDGQNAESIKVDSLNALPLQKFEGLTNKVIPFTQVVKEANINKDNVFSQIVENAKLTLSDNQTEMEMSLRPESLGKLSIKIVSENGLIMAKITTESEQIKAVIESNIAQLKEQFQHQGLSVQDFSVSVGQDQKQQLFQNQKAGFKGAKVQGIGQNTVVANESYVNRIMVKNPYLMSDSSVDYTA